jgi:hypothetical protein
MFNSAIEFFKSLFFRPVFRRLLIAFVSLNIDKAVKLEFV